MRSRSKQKKKDMSDEWGMAMNGDPLVPIHPWC